MHLVEIIGAPVACKEGVKETWRKVADWAAGQLRNLFWRPGKGPVLRFV